MKRLFCALMASGILAGGVAHGQTPPAPPPKPSVPAPPSPPTPAPAQTKPKPDAPATPPMLFNIQVDVTVTEEGGSEPSTRKEVSVTVGHGRNGSVRSGASMVGKPDDKFPFNDSRLRVDVQPSIVANGKIRTIVTMSYLSFPHFTREGEQKFEVLLEDGKPLTVSRTSSAISERRLRVEVTATILK